MHRFAVTEAEQLGTYYGVALQWPDRKRKAFVNKANLIDGYRSFKKLLQIRYVDKLKMLKEPLQRDNRVAQEKRMADAKRFIYRDIISNEYRHRTDSEKQSDIHDVVEVLCIHLTAQLSSVPCERGFSVHKLIKNDRRNRLEIATCDRLMRIDQLSETPTPDPELAQHAYNVWHARKKRRYGEAYPTKKVRRVRRKLDVPLEVLINPDEPNTLDVQRIEQELAEEVDDSVMDYEDALVLGPVPTASIVAHGLDAEIATPLTPGKAPHTPLTPRSPASAI